MIKKTILISMAVLLAGCNTSVDLEQQVDELYEQMSPKGRIAQLRTTNKGTWTPSSVAS